VSCIQLMLALRLAPFADLHAPRSPTGRSFRSVCVTAGPAARPVLALASVPAKPSADRSQSRTVPVPKASMIRSAARRASHLLM